jgi:hypothetical protein
LPGKTENAGHPQNIGIATQSALILAWLAPFLLALLPIAARWFDPAPEHNLSQPGAAVAWEVMVEVISIIGHRAWMLPASVALCSLTLALSLTACLLMRHQHLPWRHCRRSLYPMAALLPALAVSFAFDTVLPEFSR